MARESFGTRLRSLREPAGISQSELAKKIGSDQSYVSRWERNATQPEIAMVERLAAVLGVTAVELLTGHSQIAPKRTIRLTADNFASHMSTDYAASPVEGFIVPEDGIDQDEWIVSKLLAWLERENSHRPDVRYEMSRHVAAVLLERLAGGR
jgi:transcriptional regulator with XRE-family HTH domain